MPEPINIRFLGTGAAIPTLKRRHAAILFHFGSEYFLFDCGEGTQLQMDKAKISPMKLSKVFISHWHADHFSGLLPMIESLHLSRRTEPIEIYGPEASRFIDALVELSYWGVASR
jgi:ribonuclease Z